MALYSHNNNATSCNTPSKSGSAICGSDQYTCCLGQDNTPHPIWFNNFGRSSTLCQDNNTTRSDQCTINSNVHQSTGNIVDGCKADGMDPPILKSTPPWSPPDDQCWEDGTITAPLCLQNKCCYGCTLPTPEFQSAPGLCTGPYDAIDDACPTYWFCI